MRICGAKLPSDLLLAQRTGNLVVFVGAGVSMGPPSNLPSFPRLVERIADGTGEARDENEAEDRFLGRLKKNKVRVHERAAEILDDPKSMPAPIHHDLLRLFPEASAIKLVTTNFDRHFTTAASQLFASPVETSFAPALPLGDDFEGLVYVHGSVMKRPEQLVLTDEDFGRAYVNGGNGGWASRFLTAMFAKYTVLFVGYSHKDMPMHYLARGLPPAGTAKRYALIGEMADDPGHWSYLGVEPIVFPMADRYDFHALGACLKTWADRANESPVDREIAIRALVQSLPPTEEDGESYLVWVIETPDTIKYFTRYTRLPAYLPWLDARGFLDGLFRHGPLTELEDALARWLAEYFVPDHSDDLFLLAAKRHSIFNPAFAAMIAWTLSFNPRIGPSVFAKWIPILLQEPALNGSTFEGLLQKAVSLNIPGAVIDIFSRLLTPRLELEQRIWPVSDEDEDSRSPVTAQVRFPTGYHELEDTWTKYLHPLIPEIGERLWPRLVVHLSSAYSVLHSWGAASEQWDSLSWGRSAIEPHEQDSLQKPEDVLIDAIRDILEWRIQNQPDHGRGSIEALAAAGVPLLDRLSIHGVRMSAAWTPDQKLDWLSHAGYLFRNGLKHEVYLLLRDAYPAASSQLRQGVLDKIDRLEETYPNIEPLSVDYERFNILSWLLAACTGDQDLIDRLEAIRARHPDKPFEVREYPDLEHWSSTFWGGEDDKDECDEDPRSLGFENAHARIVKDRAHQDQGWGLPGFLRRVRGVVQADAAWGLGLAKYLLEAGEVGADVWAAILQGWTTADLAEDLWVAILRNLDNDLLIAGNSHAMAAFLWNAVERQQKLPLSLWDPADGLAARVWQALPADADEPDDWLQRSLNHPAGQLTRFWLQILELSRKSDDEAIRARVLANMKNRFEMIIGDLSGRSAIGVSMIASQLNFLFHIDTEWTRSTIFPLFDWSRQPCLARQAWDGYLVWASWNPVLFLELRPAFAQAFEHIHGELEHRRRRFVELVAVNALLGAESPFEQNWLPLFLKSGEPGDRVDFVRQLTFYLRGLTDDRKVGAWNTWLRHFIELRIDGAPTPPTNRELEEMLEWAPLMTPVFDDVVDLLCEAKLTELDNTPLFYNLKESDLVATKPGAVTKLVQYICTLPKVAFYHLPDLEALVRRLAATDTDRDRLVRCCDGLSRLGSSKAVELRDLVLKGGN